MSDARPGRHCPTGYRYLPISLAREPELFAKTIVAGSAYDRALAEPSAISLEEAGSVVA